MALPKLNLRYWNFAARSAAIRLVLAYHNIPFTYDIKNFAELKGEPVFKSVPILDVTLPDGTTRAFSQSVAIATFLAKLGTKKDGRELYPYDAEHAMDVDMITQTMEGEIFAGLFAVSRGLEGDALKEARQKWQKETLPRYVGVINERAKGRKYLTGDTVTVADLFVYQAWEFLTSGSFDHLDPAAIKAAFPEVDRVMKGFAAAPEWQQPIASLKPVPTHPKLNLRYLPFPGRSWAIRLALDYYGVKYDLQTIPFPELGKQPNFKSLPVLDVTNSDGTVTHYSQSLAIAQYGSKVGFHTNNKGKVQLYPSDVLEALEVDMIIQTIEFDIFGSLTPSAKLQGEEQIAFRKKWQQEKAPKYFGPLNDRFKGKAFALGGNLTLADLYLFQVWDFVINGVNGKLDGVDPAQLQSAYPEIDRIHQAVSEHADFKPLIAAIRA